MPRPGENAVAARPLHFIWIVDCSGSMGGTKIQELNTAIKEALPDMVAVAAQNPFAEMLVRTVKFSNGAQWHDSAPTKVADFKWRDLAVDGVTDLGAALNLVADALTVEKLGERGYPPVLVLLSDGQPTDDYKSGLNRLMSTQWGRRAARVAIAIGADCDHEPLLEFIGNVERPVLKANNPQQLTHYIKWVSSQVSKAASSPTSQTTSPGGNDDASFVIIPDPPTPPASGPDVW
jgi:uncharacterized protein YegL